MTTLKLIGGEALEDCKAVLEGGGEADKAASIMSVWREQGKGWGEQRAHRRSGPDQGSGPMMVLSKIRKSESVGVLTDGF